VSTRYHPSASHCSLQDVWDALPRPHGEHGAVRRRARGVHASPVVQPEPNAPGGRPWHAALHHAHGGRRRLQHEHAAPERGHSTEVGTSGCYTCMHARVGTSVMRARMHARARTHARAHARMGTHGAAVVRCCSCMASVCRQPAARTGSSLMRCLHEATAAAGPCRNTACGLLP